MPALWQLVAGTRELSRRSRAAEALPVLPFAPVEYSAPAEVLGRNEKLAAPGTLIAVFPPWMPPSIKPSIESRVDQLERAVAFAFLTAKGVIALLGWSRSTFYRRRSELPPKTRWGWRLSDLQAAIRAGQLATASVRS